MDVAVADLAPVVELDAELERAIGFSDEFRLIDFQQAVEGREVRNGGLADADRANLLRFYQDDIDRATEGLGDRGGTHPSRGSTADDGDRLHRALRLPSGHEHMKL